jgi:hypothetical protein
VGPEYEASEDRDLRVVNEEIDQVSVTMLKKAAPPCREPNHGGHSPPSNNLGCPSSSCGCSLSGSGRGQPMRPAGASRGRIGLIPDRQCDSALRGASWCRSGEAQARAIMIKPWRPPELAAALTKQGQSWRPPSRLPARNSHDAGVSTSGVIRRRTPVVRHLLCLRQEHLALATHDLVRTASRAPASPARAMGDAEPGGSGRRSPHRARDHRLRAVGPHQRTARRQGRTAHERRGARRDRGPGGRARGSIRDRSTARGQAGNGAARSPHAEHPGASSAGRVV